MGRIKMDTSTASEPAGPRWMFTVGKKVEVSFEGEGLRDVWFPATVLEDPGNSTFLVAYQQPGAGGEGILHKVTVDYQHIRPSPPHLKVKNFVLLEKVDAYYDFGWWCGVITKELADNRYNVLFKNTKKELEFIYSKVRPHMEWKGGKWFNTSQAARTTHSLIDNQIEQASPVIGKKSSAATSIMKRERQDDLYSNDKTSTNVEMMAILTIKKENPSVGQSEGADSEVSGKTDQAFSEMGDTTVNTTYSLIDNQIEQATPVIAKHSSAAISTMKREQQDDLYSNDKTSPNVELMDILTIKKEHPSVGQSEGVDSEVSGKTDQAFSKMGDTTVNTAHSLIDNQIEQAIPIIGEQSLVATSIVKIKREKDLDSNDKTSPNDEIMNADEAIKKKHPSVGQSEGFDSEVSVMTDQAFGKMGDATVSTTHSLTANQIEQPTPIIGKRSPVATTIVKRKQQSIVNNDKSSPNDGTINDDSVIKKHSSVGQSEGVGSEVSEMTDQALSKKGDMAVRTSSSIDNQIEPATSIIGNQPPVAASIMKRKREENLDSNEKSSPNNEILNDDSVIKKTNPSVGQSEGVDPEGSGMTDQAFVKKGDMAVNTTHSVIFNSVKGDTAVRTTHSLIDNQIEQTTPIIDEQSPVATSISIMKIKRQKNLDSNDKSSLNNEIMNDNSVIEKKHPSVGQSEGVDSEAFSKTVNLSYGKKVHSKQERSVELKTPAADSSKKKGKLTNELKSLQASFQALTMGSEVNSSRTRTQKIMGKKDATKDFPLRVLGLQCHRMTVSQSQLTDVVKSDTKQPDIPLEPSAMVDQEGSEGEAASVALKRERSRPPRSLALSPKTPATVEAGQSEEVDLTTSSGTKSLEKNQGPLNEQPGPVGKQNIQPNKDKLPTENTGQNLHVQQTPQKKNYSAGKRKLGMRRTISINDEFPAPVDHENGSNVSHTLLRVETGQSKEVDLTTSSGSKSLEENQGPIDEQPGLAGKQNAHLNKDELPNESNGQDLHVKQTPQKIKYSARKRKLVKGPTISINDESPAQDCQAASKENADGNLEKDSTSEASVEGKHSSMDGPEGTVEQSSKANEGWFDSGNLPFIKSTALWKTLESMEAFRMLPQKPHFRPLLEGVREGAQEGLAICCMVKFSTVFDKTSSLKLNCPRSKIEDCLETLVELENNGFDVEVIRERLTGLLLIKDKHEELEEQSIGVVGKIEENNRQETKIEEEIEEIKRQMRELEESQKQALLKIKERVSKMGVMETVIEGTKQETREVGAEFVRLAAAPFVV